MEDTANYPISTLKVDFGCSKGCPADLKSTLEQLKGVKSISIDANKGKVTVAGNVEPTTLIKLFERMGKKAQLYSFVKEPKKSKHHKHKDTSHCCFESSDSENDLDQRRKKKHDQNDHRFGYGHHGNPYTAPGTSSYRPPPMFGNEHIAPPPPVTRYHHPPMQGYHYRPYSGHHYPPASMPWNQPMGYARPPMYPRPRPRPPMYAGYYGYGQQPMWHNHGHHGSRFPRPNPMIHYNSYADNYRYM